MHNTAQSSAVLGRDGEYPPPFNVTVSASGLDIALVHLEEDTNGSKAAEVAARGSVLIGSIGVNGGAATVVCEPGASSGDMFYAGTVFAGMFGEHLKEHQLRNKRLRRLG